ncbi:MAG: DUF167 domain-containing protein [Bacteroidota bacterium]
MMFLHIRAKAGSRMNRVERVADGTVTIRIKAPAHEGRANEELLSFLSGELGIPVSRVRIASGHTSRYKKLEIDLDETEVRKKLGL